MDTDYALVLDKLQRRVTEKNIIQKDIEDISSTSAALEKKKIHVEEAKEIIYDAVLVCQSNIKYRITELVSIAVADIFPEPYSLDIEFGFRGDKNITSEAKIVLIDNQGNKHYDPMEEIGGGVCDVVSFALRLSLWSMKKPKSSSILILDEPMKFLSKDFEERAGKMIKELAKQLNLQIIMVTHEESYKINADKILEVGND